MMMILSKFYKDICLMDKNPESPIYLKYNIQNGGHNIITTSFDKVVFYTLEICGNTLNIFWGGIRTNKFMY